MSKSLLLIPGPVTVAETVLNATARPMIDHRGPEFKAILDRVSTKMKPLFGTTEAEVLILGGSGTAGLEAAAANMFGPGDYLLACPIGVFGQRLIAIARTFGAEVEVLETPWGAAVDPQALRARLAADTEKKITGILLTHNETSTGTQNDMAALAEAIRGHGAYVVVDSVSALGAAPFEMDAWGFDVVVTASQKALAVPPGIVMAAVAPRAWAKMDANKAPRFYLDLKKAREFAALGQTPFTPPVSIVYGLDVALDEFARTGAREVQERHERYAAAIRACAQALGLEIYSRENAHSVTVVAINIPESIGADAIRKALREQRGIVIGGGQGPLKGKIIRIGTMGDLSQTDILSVLGALEIALLEAGAPIKAGVGVQAALNVFLAAQQAAV